MQTEDLENILRLQNEQQKDLQECEMMLEKWEKFRTDYLSVETLLKDLPKKTTHNIMVPIGKLAYMPGRFIHTNEIMVLLGDNWFAERSASQACEITKRRLKNVEDNLKNLKQQHENIKSHMKFTSDLSNMKLQDMKEIKEALSENDKRKLEQRGKRMAYTRATKDSVKKVDMSKFTGNISSNVKSQQEDELFARLDQLEAQEMANQEMDIIENKTKPTVNNNYSVKQESTSKKVTWRENIKDEKEIETVAFPQHETATIKFTHSATNKAMLKDACSEKQIISPADIYKNYLCEQTVDSSVAQRSQSPQSILKQPNERPELKQKNTDSTTNENNKCRENTNTSSKKKLQPQAFTDVVVEHENVPQITPEAPKPERKISKFKSGRMKSDIGLQNK